MKLRVGRTKDLAICRHLFAVGALALSIPMHEAEIVQVYLRLRETTPSV